MNSQILWCIERKMVNGGCFETREEIENFTDLGVTIEDINILFDNNDTLTDDQLEVITLKSIEYKDLNKDLSYYGGSLKYGIDNYKRDRKSISSIIFDYTRFIFRVVCSELSKQLEFVEDIYVLDFEDRYHTYVDRSLSIFVSPITNNKVQLNYRLFLYNGYGRVAHDKNKILELLISKFPSVRFNIPDNNSCIVMIYFISKEGSFTKTFIDVRQFLTDSGIEASTDMIFTMC